jgi:Zn-finger nucleic acid-binding protein
MRSACVNKRVCFILLFSNSFNKKNVKINMCGGRVKVESERGNLNKLLSFVYSSPRFF